MIHLKALDIHHKAVLTMELALILINILTLVTPLAQLAPKDEAGLLHLLEQIELQALAVHKVTVGLHEDRAADRINNTLNATAMIARCLPKDSTMDSMAHEVPGAPHRIDLLHVPVTDMAIKEAITTSIIRLGLSNCLRRARRETEHCNAAKKSNSVNSISSLPMPKSDDVQKPTISKERVTRVTRCNEPAKLADMNMSGERSSD